MSCWDKRFVGMAVMVASWSKDPQRKVGAVVVSQLRRIIGMGYNGLPRGVEDTEERLGNAEARGLMTVHAEVNAILRAREPAEATLYSTSFPCAGCAGVIIQAGVRRVVSPPPEEDSGWASSWEVASEMFREAGVLMQLLRKNAG